MIFFSIKARCFSVNNPQLDDSEPVQIVMFCHLWFLFLQQIKNPLSIAQTDYVILDITHQKFYCCYPMTSPNHTDHDIPLTKLNRRLDSVWVPHLIDETFIADFLDELMNYNGLANLYYWLLYARITEAALLCAGHYADNCEFSAAGDLLVNPRQIQVHRKACGEIRIKRRHGSMSGQFRSQNLSADVFRRTFASYFNLQVKESALLPAMASALAQSGVFVESYLAFVDERMKKIADTITFLLAWPIDDNVELHRRLVSASPDSEQFIHSNLCCFTPKVFDTLGAELLNMENNYPAACTCIKEKHRKKKILCHEQCKIDRRRSAAHPISIVNY